MNMTNLPRPLQEMWMLPFALEARSFLQLDMSLFELFRIGHEIVRIRRGIKGRYPAKYFVDQVVHYLVRYASALRITDPEIVHVEIGTLFGGSLVATLTALKNAGSRQKVICIDPLNSYYSHPIDPHTKMPINQETVEENVRAFGLSIDSVEILAHSSQDAIPIKRLANYKVATLFIDGDHSYDGVKSDWENYSKAVVPGGYILIDNYRDKGWPEITDYLDSELIPRLKSFQVLGHVGASIVFQRISSPNDD